MSARPGSDPGDADRSVGAERSGGAERSAADSGQPAGAGQRWSGGWPGTVPYPGAWSPAGPYPGGPRDPTGHPHQGWYPRWESWRGHHARHASQTAHPFPNGRPVGGGSYPYPYPYPYQSDGVHPARLRGRWPRPGELWRRATAAGRPDSAELLRSIGLSLPDWVRADVERRTMERAERRVGKPVRRARRRAALSTRVWAAAAAATPVAAVVDGWGWLVVGVGALIRAGLAFREVSLLDRADSRLPMPVAPAPNALALRRSAAAEPLRRGEAGMAALAVMTRSVGAGPAAGPLVGAMRGAAELVDGLRRNAGRVLACEAAARAVGDAHRRAVILATADALLTAMREAADALDELLGAATDVLGVVSASAPELARLTDQVDALRGYAEALQEFTGA